MALTRRSGGRPGPRGSGGATVPLHRDEFDVDARSLSQRPQVAGIGGEDVIAVCGQAHDRGVDRIGQAAAGQQHARPPPQVIIQRSDVDPRQQPSHRHLTAGPSAPYPGDHAAVAHWYAARQAFPLDQGHYVPLTALTREERPPSL